MNKSSLSAELCALLWRIGNQSWPTVANTRGGLSYETARKGIRALMRMGLVTYFMRTTWRGPRKTYQACQ